MPMNAVVLHPINIHANLSLVKYLTSSSDEKCLVNFARFCGYTFIDRSIDNLITINKVVEGNKLVQLKYKVNKILEFTSERQRMSVIINSKDSEGNNYYLLYIKGSDYIINKKIRNKNSNIYKNINILNYGMIIK